MVAPAGNTAVNKVYLYGPTTGNTLGLYSLLGKTSDRIVLDTVPRAGCGVVSVQNPPGYTSMTFMQSQHTGVSSDPVLVLQKGMTNNVMWAHGKYILMHTYYVY